MWQSVGEFAGEPEKGGFAGKETEMENELVRHCIATMVRVQRYDIEIRRNAKGWMVMSVYERDTG